jgi:hypothetical protein
MTSKTTPVRDWPSYRLSLAAILFVLGCFGAMVLLHVGCPKYPETTPNIPMARVIERRQADVPRDNGGAPGYPNTASG